MFELLLNAVDHEEWFRRAVAELQRDIPPFGDGVGILQEVLLGQRDEVPQFAQVDIHANSLTGVIGSDGPNGLISQALFPGVGLRQGTEPVAPRTAMVEQVGVHQTVQRVLGLDEGAAEEGGDGCRGERVGADSAQDPQNRLGLDAVAGWSAEGGAGGVETVAQCQVADTEFVEQPVGDLQPCEVPDESAPNLPGPPRWAPPTVSAKLSRGHKPLTG
ncbi:hypothetical protein [Amycolatopsis sp.]|uniref:hypothetical protein n=1 Tax=Amycolatopsis sp. TaxID=37632 RepID=UPI002632FDF6|nr:hypothetical protein [Amycolatopsis sp.]